MTPAELSRTVLHAVCRAVEDDALPGPVPERVAVDRPRPGGRGDYATNVALRLAGPAGRPPREVAEILRTVLLRTSPGSGIAHVEITGPGFLNFTLASGSRADARAALLRTIRRTGTRYGHGDALAGTTVALDESFRSPVCGEVPCTHIRGVVVGQRRSASLPSSALRLHAPDTSPPAPRGGRRYFGMTHPAPAEEPRAALWTRTVVTLLRTQGAEAAVVPGAAEVLRPVPVPAPTTADELDARLGPDAARWALLRPAAHDRPYTDGEAARTLLVQRESNGLFLVRYAYARTRATARGAARLSLAPAETDTPARTDTPAQIGGTIPEDSAAALLTLLGDHPAVLEAAARLRAPDRLARHLEHTADAFLRFQETCHPLPLGDEKPSAAHRSRLALAEATGTVLAGGLSLLGVDAPEHL
ncbi:ArgS-related anticodon-binding protein NrtL [Streptomyces sp. NPDC050509]|uniref:ArgS-related anticodon-binding protein NrtL n=1 Tax=Streptomyces sp. NPDC050509 TaxID=3365620 RepID=UPI0037ADBA08